MSSILPEVKTLMYGAFQTARRQDQGFDEYLKTSQSEYEGKALVCFKFHSPRFCLMTKEEYTKLTQSRFVSYKTERDYGLTGPTSSCIEWIITDPLRIHLEYHLNSQVKQCILPYQALKLWPHTTDRITRSQTTK